jgi:hypothetical protein
VFFDGHNATYNCITTTIANTRKHATTLRILSRICAKRISDSDTADLLLPALDSRVCGTISSPDPRAMRRFLCINYLTRPQRRDFLPCITAGLPAKENMSTKIDCLVYLKSKLANDFTKLTTGDSPNLPAAQNVQRLVGTAENISDGYFAIIEPLFDPVTPKFMLLVRNLNHSIITGTSSPANFDEYVKLLVTALQS